MTPAIHAQMLATRAEAQLAGDWMLVPTCRNLHWRYAVLHSASVVCKQKVAPGETGGANLSMLIEAATSIWQRLQKGYITVDGMKRPHNHDVAKLYQDDNIMSTEKLLYARI